MKKISKNPGRQAAGKKLAEWNRNRKQEAVLINKAIEEQEERYIKRYDYLIPALIVFVAVVGIVCFVKRTKVGKNDEVKVSNEIKVNKEVIKNISSKNNIFDM